MAALGQPVVQVGSLRVPRLVLDDSLGPGLLEPGSSPRLKPQALGNLPLQGFKVIWSPALLGDIPAPAPGLLLASCVTLTKMSYPSGIQLFNCYTGMGLSGKEMR